MQVKTCPATVKAAGAHEGVDEGIVEAIVAAYNVDSVGDRIVPGAFKNTLARRKASGSPIPFVWNHQSSDPESYVGEVLEAEERPEGLWVKARMDLDEPKALKVYKLLKGRRVQQFSFAYDEVDARPAAKSDDGALQELHELEIHECGPTILGANRATALLGVKHQQPVTVNVHNVMPGAEQAKSEPAPQAEQPAEGQDPVAKAQQELDAAREAAQEQAHAAAERVQQAEAALAAAPGSATADQAETEQAESAEGSPTHDSDNATGGEKAGRVLSARTITELREALERIQKVLATAEDPKDEGKSASSVEKATPAEPAAAEESQVAPEAAPDTKSDAPAAHGTASARLRTALELAFLEAEGDSLTY